MEDHYTDRQTDRQTDKQTNRQTYRQPDRHTDRQTHRQTDRQTHRQTYQAHILSKCEVFPQEIPPSWYVFKLGTEILDISGHNFTIASEGVDSFQRSIICRTFILK